MSNFDSGIPSRLGPGFQINQNQTLSEIKNSEAVDKTSKLRQYIKVPQAKTAESREIGAKDLGVVSRKFSEALSGHMTLGSRESIEIHSVNSHLEITPSQQKQLESRLRELDNAFQRIRFCVPNAENKLEIVEYGSFVDQMSDKQIARSILTILKPGNDQERPTYGVHRDNPLANLEYLQAIGLDVNIVVVVNDEHINEFAAMFAEYRMIKSILTQAKVKDTGEKTIENANTQRPASAGTGAAFSATIVSRQPLTKIFASRMTESFLLMSSRREERKQEIHQQEKDDLRADVEREVVRKQVKSDRINKEGIQHQDKMDAIRSSDV